MITDRRIARAERLLAVQKKIIQALKPLRPAQRPRVLDAVLVLEGFARVQR